MLETIFYLNTIFTILSLVPLIVMEPRSSYYVHICKTTIIAGSGRVLDVQKPLALGSKYYVKKRRPLLGCISCIKCLFILIIYRHSSVTKWLSNAYKMKILKQQLKLGMVEIYFLITVTKFLIGQFHRSIYRPVFPAMYFLSVI